MAQSHFERFFFLVLLISILPASAQEAAPAKMIWPDGYLGSAMARRFL